MTGKVGPHLVVAALLLRNGRALLLHRTPTRQWYPDCWDLPGGHVEAGEDPDAALSRELFEELGLTDVLIGGRFAQVRGEDFTMDVYVVDTWVGEPAVCGSTEHDALAWLNNDEVTGLKLADPRLPPLLGAVLR